MSTRYLEAAVVVAALAVCQGSAAAAATAQPGGGRIYGDAQRGKDDVQRWCTTCHAADVSGTDGAPALARLKENPKKTSAYIRGFLAVPHAPMPPLALTTQEVEDIVAYILGK